MVLCVGKSLTVILSQNFHQWKKTLLITCPYIDKYPPGRINTIHVFHNHATCCLQKQQHFSGIFPVTFSEASVLGLPKTSVTWKSLHNDITHQNNVRSTYGNTGWKPYQLPTFTVQILWHTNELEVRSLDIFFCMQSHSQTIFYPCRTLLLGYCKWSKTGGWQKPGSKGEWNKHFLQAFHKFVRGQDLK